jgi:hypothetical protein
LLTFSKYPQEQQQKKIKRNNKSVFFFLFIMQSIRCLQKKIISGLTLQYTQHKHKLKKKTKQFTNTQHENSHDLLEFYAFCLDPGAKRPPAPRTRFIACR